MYKFDKKSLALFLSVLVLLIISIIAFILYFFVYHPYPSVSSPNGWPLFVIIGNLLEGFLTVVLIITSVSYVKYINLYRTNMNPIVRVALITTTIIMTVITVLFLRMLWFVNLLIFPTISLIINLVSYIVINFISPISTLRKIREKNPSKLEQIENL